MSQQRKAAMLLPFLALLVILTAPSVRAAELPEYIRRDPIEIEYIEDDALGGLTVTGKRNTLKSALKTTPAGADSLYGFLHDRIWAGELTITFPISDYDVADSEVSGILYELVRDPDMFLVKSFKLQKSKTQYRVLVTQTSMDMDAYEDAKKLYTEAISEITSLTDESWCDAEKVLFVHEYFAVHFQYDYSHSNYDAYTIFRDGKGVCQGYGAGNSLHLCGERQP